MRITLFYIILFLTLTASAASNNKLQQKQFKNDITSIKDNLKKGRDLEKGEKTLRAYLRDTLHQDDITLHLLLNDVLRKQYASANEKMYLRTSTDTATLMNIGKRMFLAAESLDSLDARPDHKGRVAPAHRHRHAHFLKPYYDNLYKGGVYFYKHKKWQEAWECFDTYIQCHRQPLFSTVELDTTKLVEAAFLAMHSAANQSSFQRVMKYSEDALKEKSEEESTLRLLANISIENKDTTRYLHYLNEGFRKYYSSDYFFPYLIDYHLSRGDYQKASEYTDTALSKDSVNVLFLLARHEICMLQKDYAKALSFGLSLLERDDSIATPNYNVGYIYYLKAQEAMKAINMPYRKRLTTAQEWYRKSMPYMQRYKQLAPEKKALWKPILYDIYLNLNMGKEFMEIEGL